MRTTLDADHPQAGETWHFQSGHHVRTTFARPYVRHGQVAHVLHQRHRFTTFECFHSHVGDVVFFDSRSRVHASFSAKSDGTLYDWARREARGKCLACEESMTCPCLRGALCLRCYHRVRSALAPAEVGACVGLGDVVVAVRTPNVAGRDLAGSRGVVESRHDPSGLLQVRFCVCASRRVDCLKSLHLCVVDPCGRSQRAREHDAACVALAPQADRQERGGE